MDKPLQQLYTTVSYMINHESEEPYIDVEQDVYNGKLSIVTEAIHQGLKHGIILAAQQLPDEIILKYFDKSLVDAKNNYSN